MSIAQLLPELSLIADIIRQTHWRLEARTNPGTTIQSDANPLVVLPVFYSDIERYRVVYVVADVEYEYRMNELPKTDTFEKLKAVIAEARGCPEAVETYGTMMTDDEFTFHLLHSVFHQSQHGPGRQESADGP